MENRGTVWPMSRTLVPFLLFVIAALLAANLWLGGRLAQAGEDDSGAGPAGAYHEHWLCVKSGGSTVLTFVHASSPYDVPTGLCENGQAFVVSVRDNGH